MSVSKHIRLAARAVTSLLFLALGIWGYIKWAQSLPDKAALNSRRTFTREGPLTWPGSDYIAADVANRVPVALNTPTTYLEGSAVRVEYGWQMELVLHLFIMYPKKATFRTAVGLELEEGIFHASRRLLTPYCAEYRWSIRSDDPALDIEGPIRSPLEKATTWLLREMGAGY